MVNLPGQMPTLKNAVYFGSKACDDTLNRQAVKGAEATALLRIDLFKVNSLLLSHNFALLLS
jgi:hypothetical protein